MKQVPRSGAAHRTSRSRQKRFSKPQIVRQMLALRLLTVFAVMSAVSGALLALALPEPNQQGSAWASLLHKLQQVSPLAPAEITRPVNLLVLGIDNSDHATRQARDRQEALGGNSDLILLVRLIPATHEINILSIPRDTLVHIPGQGVDKVNDANMLGGPALAAKTVSHLLGGVKFDRYVRIDTQGMVPLVDALGGVEITVPKAMNYEDHSQHLSIHFQPGRQKLSGQHLEEYVRFRHDALGDISRVQRQQEVFKAIVAALKQPSTLFKLPQLLQVAQDNLDTNLSAQEKLAIVQFLAQTDRQHMHLVMLPGRFSRPDEYAASYWIADPEKVAPIVAEYFDPTATPDMTPLSRPKDQLRVVIASLPNQTPAVTKAIARLQHSGFTNTSATAQPMNIAIEAHQQTQIIAQQGDVAAANAVKAALGLGQVQVASTGDINSDITVVLGADAKTSAR